MPAFDSHSTSAFFGRAEENLLSFEQEVSLDSTELKVQKTFPLYRVDFNHKSVQEKVYAEFLKELKEKEKSE